MTAIKIVKFNKDIPSLGRLAENVNTIAIGILFRVFAYLVDRDVVLCGNHIEFLAALNRIIDII